MTAVSILIPVFVVGLAATTATTEVVPKPPSERRIDLAICLDTSGSMRGLIDAARQNVWAIVNDLALAEPTPKLRIALLTFGNDGHSPADGWVKVETPLTDDLDRVSERLFAQTTNGGTEYVGRVLEAAIGKLEWSVQADALKIIVVAGNEAADQDPVVDFREVCKRAITNGILVDSIYCGNPADRLAATWRDVALRADGQFAAIDQNDGTVVIATPFDDRLAALSASLNATYIPYGDEGDAGSANQVAQDRNAGGLNGAAAAQRAYTKAGSNYSCAAWDLVDAVRTKLVVLEDLEPEALPEAMRAMSAAERARYVEDMGKKRARVQKDVAETHAEREAFVRAEIARRAIDTTAAFGHAVRRAVREQAKGKGFGFAKASSRGSEVSDEGGGK